jgi:hypothetical protein
MRLCHFLSTQGAVGSAPLLPPSAQAEGLDIVCQIPFSIARIVLTIYFAGYHFESINRRLRCPLAPVFSEGCSLQYVTSF